MTWGMARDEIAIRRSCRCGFVKIHDGMTITETDIVVDGYVLHDRDPACPLHADAPGGDMPQEAF